MRKITLITSIIFIGFLTTEGLFAAETKKTLPLRPAKVANVLQQIPEVKPLPPAVPIAESTYNYNPSGKPDPFRPFVETDLAAKKKEEKKDVSSIYPLQRAEVDQFRLVGIAGDQSRRVAIIIEDMTKKHYPLVVGTHIGMNNGKVVEILPDRVIVEEYKTKKVQRIILRLHKKQDEVKP